MGNPATHRVGSAETFFSLVEITIAEMLTDSSTTVSALVIRNSVQVLNIKTIGLSSLLQSLEVAATVFTETKIIAHK